MRIFAVSAWSVEISWATLRAEVLGLSIRLINCVITVGNEVIMIDRAAFSESGANTYSFSWETYDGQVISLIGLRAEFQEFDLIA